MNIVVILSGGVGSRMKMSRPKQYILVNNKPVFLYSFLQFCHRTDIDAFVIVVAPEWEEFIQKTLRTVTVQQPVFYAIPGSCRQSSIFNAMSVAKENLYIKDKDLIVIHDAVRPLVSDSIISKCLKYYEGFDGVLPVIPLKDTVYRSNDSVNIVELLPRHELFAGQSPESFYFLKYWTAHKNLSESEMGHITGGAELAHRGGLKIRLIEGSELNFKITTTKDLDDFQTFFNMYRSSQ